MSKPEPSSPSKVTILVIDDDPSSQETLRQMLDSEGWSVHVAAKAALVLPTLAKSEWTMVIANVAVTGISGPLFTTLKELALAPAMEDGKGRLRVMFLLPETIGPEAQRLLESTRLPYVRRPYNLQDFLDKVSDLLIERGAIPNPIRRVRFGGASSSRQSRLLHQQPRHHERGQGMFAKHGDYAMTEEEIAEYEKQEKEEQLRRKKKNTLSP
jgi:DNA-binding NtrC family response regulator